MIDNRVSIVRCRNYDQGELSPAIAESFDLAEPNAKNLYRGKDVLVKINHLSGGTEEIPANTHIEFTRAVIRHLKALGATPTVSDSPGPLSITDECFRSSGYEAMCLEEGTKIVTLSSKGYKEIPIPGGKKITKVLVSRLLLESELIVSLPKMKTHVQTVFTGAVKNWFGALPLSERRRLHRLKRYETFCEAIVDLYSGIGKGLVLMDAVIGMQGHGPASGERKEVGLVLASKNCANLDVVACNVAGLGPGSVHTVKETISRGLAEPLDRIEVVGEPLSDVTCKFDIPPRLLLRANPLLEHLTDLFLGLYRGVVLVQEEYCTSCGLCAEICPVGAIMIDKYCRIDYSRCIKCYCCFEICPHGAIVLKQSFWGRILRRVRAQKKADEPVNK
ncbi:DUF362 domain-containing protein [bacterium]|nr:DUF362 domain-containing protein [bacterium]